MAKTQSQNSLGKSKGKRKVDRLPVLKTYKLYLNGGFPRTESGRSWKIEDLNGSTRAHLCRASRKDLRDAVQAAAKARSAWGRKTAYNRGQILYRMAEMLEGKAEEFTQVLQWSQKRTRRHALKEVEAAIDRLVCFGGWADKFPQVLGCANPVAGPYYNFTVPEATGVIAVIAPDAQPLLALVSLLAPPLCAGNTVVALGSESQPAATALFGEVCATSDVPPGVVNLLTGFRQELLPVVRDHRGVDGIHAAVDDAEERRTLELGRAENLKRVRVLDAGAVDWYDPRECHSPYWIEPFLEMKTIWHPSSS
ncbi:MAG: aldehyde dehydrogenase family protein [Planctomycetota bacterium]|nr:MAG: aldehyde dehydrogenase family protein [Planctomycetota bacterium]